MPELEQDGPDLILFYDPLSQWQETLPAVGGTARRSAPAKPRKPRGSMARKIRMELVVDDLAQMANTNIGSGDSISADCSAEGIGRSQQVPTAELLKRLIAPEREFSHPLLLQPFERR